MYFQHGLSQRNLEVSLVLVNDKFVGHLAHRMKGGVGVESRVSLRRRRVDPNVCHQVGEFGQVTRRVRRDGDPPLLSADAPHLRKSRGRMVEVVLVGDHPCERSVPERKRLGAALQHLRAADAGEGVTHRRTRVGQDN